MNSIEIINKSIDAINNNEYEAKLINFGYSYSDNITCIFQVLSLKEMDNIFLQTLNIYSAEVRKQIVNNIDPMKLSLYECVVYFNEIWHIEGSGIYSGIVLNSIKNERYLKALTRFKELIENK